MNATAAPKLVGPVIRGVDDDIIDAVIAAAEVDNPDVELTIEDRGGYVRVQAAGAFRLTQSSMANAMGVRSGFPRSSRASCFSLAGWIRETTRGCGPFIAKTR